MLSYLPYELKTNPLFADVYTVFAGGDDLLMIGPWNTVIELAKFLRTTFANYVCDNPAIHFSAGITLHKPHTPLDKLAHEADTALERSKSGERNAVTLSSQTAEWDRFLGLQAIKEILQHWRTEKLLNNAMIYRLNDFIGMAEEERQIRPQQEIHMDRMQCLKWRALFCYMSERNIGRGVKDKVRRSEMINEFSKTASWLKDYGTQLRMVLWDIIYNCRKGA